MMSQRFLSAILNQSEIQCCRVLQGCKIQPISANPHCQVLCKSDDHNTTMYHCFAEDLLSRSMWWYSWLSLSRPCLSRITAYLEVKIMSLPKHESLITTGEKYCGKEEKLLLFFHNIFTISLVISIKHVVGTH